MGTYPWKSLLTLDRRYCILCWANGRRDIGARMGGPTILPEQTTIDRYGPARYWTSVRANLLRHLRTEHGDSSLARRVLPH